MNNENSKIIENKFKKLLKNARKELRKEWGMLQATEQEFRQKADYEMQKLLKEVRSNKKRITKAEKDIISTIDYFDNENIKIKEFIKYSSKY